MISFSEETIIGGEMIPSPTKCMLKGQVTVDATGVSKKRIYAVNRRTLQVFAATNSNLDGTWALRGLPPYPDNQVMIIAFDDTGQYNSETADHVSQALMHP